MHLKNLSNVKPMIDNRDPRRPKTSNGKAQRLEEERNNQIMHENTILLNKLSRILTREPEAAPLPLLARGLNENTKKQDRERIDRENQALLRRLQDVRPSIDKEKAAADYDLHLDLLRSHQASFQTNPFLAPSMDGSSLDGSSRMGRRPASAASTAMSTEVPAVPPAPAPPASATDGADAS